MKAFIYSILVAVAIAGAPFSLAALQTNAKYDRLERAAALIREGKLPQAEAELQVVLRHQPHEANALNLLGVIRAQQQRGVEAEQLFLGALNESPKLLGVYLNLGRLYLDQHKADRSLWAFIEAGKLAPDRADINYNLAALYEERHEFTRSLDYLEKAPRSSWGLPEIQLSVECYLGLGRTDEALRASAPLRRAGALTADEAAAFASVFTEHDLPDQAIEILEAARQQGPTSFPLLFQLGASYARKGEWSRAEEFYAAALATKVDSVATLQALARVARARGELEKALSYLVRARKLAPDAPSVLYDFAVVAFSMDLILDALPVAERLYRQQPDDPAYVHLLAVSLFRHDEKAEAEKLLRHYIELRPKEARGYFLLGAMLYTVKRYAEARQLLEQSLALGQTPDNLYLLAVIADVEGDREAASRWLQSVLRSEPSHAAAHTLLGVVYAEQNKYSLARTTLERAVELNPKDLRAHYQLALVYTKLGEKDRAQKMFAAADQLRNEQRDQETIGFKLIDPPQ